ncbi:hypothetical protein IGL98_000775 [Enterococcus sp. DIV0840]|uniref:BspA family leucine-rich repeat surface protein n=1 Tax=Enterococcus TaxID=1350 RepID=UPI001A8CC2A8|nr:MULTISPECIES: BspA family leucine-rich repeat surface protein [Enterococcus]MBO0434038.1 BspA family leucine-rich repeat surface protein [Enterococcus sp. DIV0849a]MBO0472944.1 BspA family leucine-rich repeat surface protein [Enterococcus ureasiticus]
MKKNYVIKGLMFFGLIGILGLQSPLVLAEEQNESVKAADSSELKVLDETEATDEMIPTTIEILSEKTTLEINETLVLSAKIISDSNIKTAIWTTSDETIATVSDSGIVTGKKAGSVSITASTSNGKTASVVLTVTEKKETITGTFGTVPWTWEAETQTLTFGEGEFPSTQYYSDNILNKIENSTLLQGKKIKRIRFTKLVKANKISHYIFSRLSELESIEGSSLLNTSDVSDMDFMFLDDNNLTTLDVSNWDTSNVSSMNSMFSSARNLTSLDVSKWNTSNVSSMSSLFSGTNSLTDLDVSTWDTSSVTNMEYIFLGASSLTTLDVSAWDTSNVTTMSGMFAHANSLMTLNVSKWDTSNVTHMNSMFSGTKSLTTLDVSTWNTSNVTNMTEMFMDASELTALDVSKWNVSNVKTMLRLFWNAKSLTTLDISNWDTSKNAYISSIFSYTTSLDTLILGKNCLLKGFGLPERKNKIYTGKWILVSHYTQNSYSSSQDLMTNYDGTKPGKYVREKFGDSTKVSGIELTPPVIELAVSEEAILQAKITPATASNKKVTYTISDNTVATISADGIVKGLKKGTAVITATTEDGSFQATSTVKVVEPSAFLLETFYLGIDSYVIGSVNASSSAKKVQLIINDEVITTSTLLRDGSFELDTEGMITKVTDKVEIVALDRKNKELERAPVTIKEKSYALTVNPYTLYEDSIVTGKTDYFHTHVALLVNGEEIERKLLSSTRQFSFDVEGLVDYTDDEVEVVGYRYEEEITRKEVTIQEPVIEMSLPPYKVDEPYVTGKVTGKSAKNVRLYVNGRRQQTIKVADDGTFSLLGVAILSPKDKVQLAVLNDAGIEIQRFSVT